MPQSSGPSSKTQRHAPVLSILCPVYNEQAVIPLFLERLRPVLDALAGRYDVRLVFLNNASRDDTLGAIETVAAAWPATYVLTMSSNVGYQRSLDRGLREVASDIYVVIDVDCEDPPEMIAEFVACFEAGSQIVYGERVQRSEPHALQLARRMFYRVLQATADDRINLHMAEFSLFTRPVRDAFLEENTSFPFIRSSISRVGFASKALAYKRGIRAGGESKYSFLSNLKFATAGLLASSTLPLRVPIYAFPVWFVGMLALSIAYAATPTPGILAAILLTSFSYIALALALGCLYIARTYKNGLGRPSAFIDHRQSRLPPGSP